MSKRGAGHVLFSSLLYLIAAISTNACSGSINSGPPATAGTAGAEQAVGERLFLETRFAQAFKVFLDAGGDVNDPNAGESSRGYGGNGYAGGPDRSWSI